MGLVAIGPLALNVVFLALVLVGAAFHALAGALPDALSKFVACFGLASILDPLLILVVDLGYQNYDCGRRGGCEGSAGYISTACACFTGDWMKVRAEAGHRVRDLMQPDPPPFNFS